MFQRSRAKPTRQGLLLLALALGLCLAGLLRPAAPVHAQARLISLVSQDNGHTALGLALRRLDVAGTLMQTVAHPDDEHNQLFAMLTRGQGFRSVDVQTTRGEGGQNEIGPELFRDLGVLRTAELMSAHRLDGAEQWFTRAIDYGYSFDPEEVYRTWGGRDAVVGDFVRLIRMTRPDVGTDDVHPGAGRRPGARGDGRPDARGVSRRGRPGAVPGTDRGRPAAVAGAEALLLGPAERDGRAAAGWGVTRRGRPRRQRRRRRVRSAARTDLPGHRRQRQELPQVPGDGAARASAGRRRRRRALHGRAAALPVDGLDNRRRARQAGDLALRRHRHEPGRPGGVCRPESARRVEGRACRHRRAGETRAEGVRHG